MQFSSRFSPILLLLMIWAASSLGTSCTSSSHQSDAEGNHRSIRPDTAEPFAPAYALFTSKNSTNQFLFIDSSWQKICAAPIPFEGFNREFIMRKGKLYHVNPQTDYLIQYNVSFHGLDAIDSIPLVNDNMEQYHWKNNSDTLLICNVVHGEKETARFYEIDTEALSLVREATLPIPPAAEDFDILSLGLLRYENDKLWLAYAYSKMTGRSEYTTIDTMYYRTLDFASLQVLSEQKDSRSTYPGGINTIQSYSGTDENGDLYFMSGPGIAAGNTTQLPTAVFRKKQGADSVDQQYMINVSREIANHAYGFWYLGNHQALIRSERSDKYHDFSNHHLVYQFDLFLTDLNTGKMEKLPLPLDKGTRKENMIQDGYHLYFAIDDSENGHSVWNYDMSTKKACRMLSPDFPIDYLLRMDKIQ